LIAILSAACTRQISNPIAKSTALYQTGEHRFEVVAWVNNPEPPQGSRIMLYGSLIKDGVFLGGMAMVAEWPDASQERGVPNCSVQVIYQAGVCIIETKDLPAGVYVPITISFEYQGQTYSGGTGFTPR
jgi:hypothetical protein